MNKEEVTRIEPIYCPVNGWDCPYWTEGGICTLEHVEIECDDFMAFDYAFAEFGGIT